MRETIRTVDVGGRKIILHVKKRDAPTKDHWLEVGNRIGYYRIFEGAGTNGGQWKVRNVSVYSEMRGDEETFKSRAEAEKYARENSD